MAQQRMPVPVDTLVAHLGRDVASTAGKGGRQPWIRGPVCSAMGDVKGAAPESVDRFPGRQPRR